jgi:hypothetical protein
MSMMPAKIHNNRQTLNNLKLTPTLTSTITASQKAQGKTGFTP